MYYIALVVFAGCIVALQPPINAALSRTVGLLESGLISFAIGAVFLAVPVLLMGRGNVFRVFETPAWQWAGGVLGGISSGSPLLFTLAVKPTASIGKRQRTIDISKKEDTDLSIGGRHDPCIIPRAIPVIENAAALVILDLLLTDRRNSHVG